MNIHDSLNVQRVFRVMAVQWGCSVQEVKETIRKTIDRSWEKAMSDPNTKALWSKYFPKGKPTPDEYILRLGKAHETGENIPYLLDK